MRQAKMLPKEYRIEVTDVFGQQTIIDGLRRSFSTHDAAESYARMYKQNFGEQYSFRVVGSQVKKPKELEH